MFSRFLFGLGFISVAVAEHAQSPDEVLPELTVYSPRVANQKPVATFAMPVSALRFEPRVDLQPRNFAEAQADVTIRGGIFENTGFSVGAVSLFDPQTGHYFAEIPIAPRMLSAPTILTGADLASHSTNATSGAVTYQWRPIQTAGFASVGAGQYDLLTAEFYQGYVQKLADSRQQIGVDAGWAHSDGNGSIKNGDHDFDRVDARIQLRGAGAQTDLFAGYQQKFFGWPNLYTPFNSNESEDLQTLLVVLNHRRDLGAGDFVEAGAYYRRNEDDYAFNRFAPVGPIHPFQHTTWVRGAAAGARLTSAQTTFNLRAEVLSDELESTSLTFGPYHSRTITKLAFVPERAWSVGNGANLRVKVGATYDDTNRDDSAVSPIVEIAREQSGSSLNRIYLSYAQTTQVPTYTALKSNSVAGLFRGNQTLSRQKTRNLELGVSGIWADWTGHAAMFCRDDESLVDWTFQRGVTARSANPVDVATTGAEFVASRSWKACTLVLGYTWLAKDPDYRGATVDASFYALNYARHRFTAALVARLTSELELRWDNALRFQEDNPLRTTGGDEDLASSLGVTWRPAAWRNVSITVQADNLWDSDYQSVPSVPAARRQISATLSYAW